MKFIHKVGVLLLLPTLTLPTLTAETVADIAVAEQIVDNFYKNLKILSSGENDDSTYEAGERCISIAASADAGLFFPNEFKKLGMEGSHDESSLICKSYVSQFKRMASTYKMQFSYQIKSTIPFYEAEWNKGDQQASFVYCIVEKRYGPSVFNGVIQDTVLINSNRKIIGIRNWSGGQAYTDHNVPNVTVPSPGPTGPSTEVDLTQLQFDATRYYTNRQYSMAYRTYQTILQKDPDNANAYYRLAIMSYRRQGCSQYPRKQTDKLAMDYITRAYDCGDRALKQKIDNILYYW